MCLSNTNIGRSTMHFLELCEKKNWHQGTQVVTAEFYWGSISKMKSVVMRAKRVQLNP